MQELVYLTDALEVKIRDKGAIMKKYKFQFLIIALILLSACDATIHEYPGDKKTSIVVELTPDHEPPIYYKQAVYDYNGGSNVTEMSPDLSLPYIPDPGFRLRYVVELYNVPLSEIKEQTKPVARRVVTTLPDKQQRETLHFDLPDRNRNYSVLTWRDYVLENNADDWYYETPVLTAVTEKRMPEENSYHMKDALTGNKDFYIDASQTSPALIPVSMTRALGRFRLIANDLSAFKEAGGSTERLQIKVVYRQYVSKGYNVAKQQPNLFLQSYSDQPSPAVSQSSDGSNEGDFFEMAYDYILASTGKEDHVIVDLFVYDENDNVINYYEGIDIPLYRNRESVVYGPFLTRKKGVGGVGVDDVFEGEHVVIVKD